jgi:2-methylaconitate cis-trans-isomerase PrpF
VDLFLHAPVGTKTGHLLPTGNAQDQVLGYDVSCVDVAVPMVVARASQFGKTAQEAVSALEADAAFMREIRQLWSAAGLLMGLRRRDGGLMTREELNAAKPSPSSASWVRLKEREILQYATLRRRRDTPRWPSRAAAWRRPA